MEKNPPFPPCHPQTGALLSFFNSPTKTVEQCKALIRIPNSKLRLTDSHWLLHMIMDKEVW